MISGIINSQITPRMLSKTDWNWGAKCGLFFLGTNILSFTYCYFRLPESRGRTYGELDILFANKVPARKFTSTKVEEFETGGVPEVVEEMDIKEKGTTEHVEVK